MLDETQISSIIRGHGGGGKKGGATSADDTMRSFAHVRLVDAVSEGEIEGLVDGANSILINKTPISNVEDSAWQFRAGLPDDEPLIGFNTTEAYSNVGAEVSQELGPVIRTITDTNIDAVKLLMQLNVLYRLSSKGALKTVDSGWRIDLRPAGGDWTEVVTFDLEKEKCTSPVQFQHVVPLTGPGPWDIRVRARYGERDKHEQSISWIGYSEITNGRFTNPHTARVALALSSEHVGSSTPTRHYHVRGRKILIPSNYNPITRTYTGVWNGNFVRAWSNNPAWVLYDMVENNIFGIGNEVNISVLSKWRLYTIAQYCDQLVPSGYKDANGNDVMEPRYSFNGVITDKKEAFDALRAMTAVWRGMGFYSLNQFYTTVDMPQDPAHIYGPANVVEGRFEYSTSSIKARHSVVMVRFNDPNNLFEPAIEPVVDNEMLKKIGWREKTLELTGCSSRSLAHRYGKWVIETEKSETETVTFSVGLDSIHALPGEVIAINDPRRAEVRTSGRIAAVTGGNSIRMDQVLDPSVNKTGATLYVHKPDGTIFKRTVNVQANGHTMNVGAGNATDDLVGCVYVLSATNVAPRLYRILSIDEESTGATFKITALQYDPTKFARVEQGIHFDPPPVTLDVSKLEPPSNLQVQARAYTDGGRIRNDLELSWTPSPSQLISEYRVFADTPTATNVPVGATNRNSITYTTYEPGEYIFRVRAVSVTGSRSAPASITHVVNGATEISVGRVTDLVNAVTGQAGGQFTGPDVSIRWKNMMAVSTDSTVPLVEEDPALYAGSTVRVYWGTTLLREQNVIGNSFTYSLEMNRADAAAQGLASARRALRFEVTLTDKEGRVSLPSTITLTNPAPAAPILRASSAGTIINLDWDPVNDRDLEGYLVWISTNSAFIPAQTTPTRRLKADQMTYTGIGAQEYFVAVAAYDAFGEDTLNYSSKIAVSTGLDPFDNVAPSVPTGLQLSSTPDTLTASWNANPEADLSRYEIEITEGAGNAVSFLTTTTSYVWNGTKPNIQFSVRIRAVDRNGNRSNWTAPVTHTTARDTTPPAVPTGLTVTPGFNALWVRWNANTEADFSHYEIFQSNTTTAPGVNATPTYTSAASTINVTGLAEAVTRHFWVRAVDTSGNKSAWTARVQGTTSSIWTHVSDPAVPTGLALATTLDGSTAKLSATWAAATNCVSYELGITEDAGNEVVIGAAELRYEWNSVPNRSWAVRVRGVNSVGRKSAWSAVVNLTSARDTIPPAVPTNLSIASGFGTFLLKWDINTESDLARYEVWEGNSATVGQSWVNTYRTTSPVLSLSGYGEGISRHFFVRAVDTSGNTSAWSDGVTATTASLGVTQGAPAVPTGLTTSTRLTNDTAFVRAAWSASNNSVSYEIGVTEAGANEIVIGVGDTSYEWIARKGVSYTIRVRGVNALGQKSAWTAVSVQAAATDTVAPATPATPTMRSGFNTLWVDWVANTEADLSHYEIAAASTTFTVGAAAANIVGTSRTNSTVLTEIPDGQTRFVRIRAVDTSGNTSGWSGIVSRQVVALPDVTITSEKLAGLVNATSFASGIEPVTIISGGPLPTTKSTTAIVWGGKLYRWNGTAYTASTAVTDLDGLIVGSQIAAGGINTRELAAYAVNASKMAIGDFTNLNPDTMLVDPAAWTFAAGMSLDTTASVLSEAPRYGTGCIYMAPTSDSSLNTFGSRFTVEPNDSLRVIADIESLDATPIGSARVLIRWYNAAGASAGNPTIGTVSASGRVTISNNVTVPATARTAAILAGTINANGGRWAVSAIQVYRRAKGELIVDGTLKAIHMAAEEILTSSAQIRNAIINDAHITQLSAAKLQAGTALAGSITVSGDALSTIRSWANDPAARINQASTQIDPGKIVISGGTTLASWRDPGDLTKISGGNISANSIATNRLTIGNRAFSLENVRFECDPGNNTVSWTAGYLVYINDAGNRVAQSVPAGTSVAVPLGGVVYIYWQRGATELLSTTSTTIFSNEEAVVLGSYRGGLNFNADYGRTVIDGSEIRTGTIRASQLVQTENLITNSAQIAQAIITDGHVVNLSAAKLEAGSALAGSITVNGDALSDIRARAADPAARINSASTQIDPGKIMISGSATLADWRKAGDLTKIDGGALSANTVSANKLTIGNRAFTLESTRFETDSATNTVSWTAGWVAYINDAGTRVAQAVPAGSASWTAGVLYIYWERGATALATTNNTSILANDEAVVIASYRGGLALNTNYGRTVIDGAEIRTGTIRATNLIQTEEVITNRFQMGAGTIRDVSIIDLDASKIIANSVLSGEVVVEGRALASMGSDTLFDTMNRLWTKVQGAGSAQHIAQGGAFVAGDRSIVTNTDGPSWWVSPDRIAINKNKLYQVTFSVRRNGTATAGNFHLGLCGFAADKSTKVNVDGSDAYSSQYFYAAQNRPQSELTSAFSTYTFYMKGASLTPGSVGNGSIGNPYRLHDNVRYVSPMAVLNLGHATGSNIVLNYVKIVEVNEDAAAIVNAGSTKIEPGMITISGASTLADWRTGGDETRINGGMISANTIRANSLEIGSRNLTLTGIQFEHNRPAANNVWWSAGAIRWVNDAGGVTSTAISSGSAVWTSGILYIYWTKGAATLSTTTNQTTAFGVDNVILATYQGGKALDPDYGRTVIDGSDIKTGTVTADRLNVSSLSAITAVIGTLRTATSGARMELHSDKLLVYDASGTLRVRIGNLN